MLIKQLIWIHSYDTKHQILNTIHNLWICILQMHSCHPLFMFLIKPCINIDPMMMTDWIHLTNALWHDVWAIVLYSFVKREAIIWCNINVNVIHWFININIISESYIWLWNFFILILDIPGPDFWGRLNPKWSHCSRGRRQSPIDINPSLLLYDPSLSPIIVRGDHVSSFITCLSCHFFVYHLMSY